MKYCYKIVLELEAKEKNAAERLIKYHELLTKKAVEAFNGKAALHRKPKKILDVVVTDQLITIELESAERLTSPFKSMRSYSQYLLNNGMRKLAENNNALFRSVSVEDITPGLTDEKLVNIILHSAFRKSDKDEDFLARIRKLVEEMDMDEC